MKVIAELDELIVRDEELQDYCSETGPNDAMRRVVALKAIREAVYELIVADTGYDEAWNAHAHVDRDDQGAIDEAEERIDVAAKRRASALSTLQRDRQPWASNAIRADA